MDFGSMSESVYLVKGKVDPSLISVYCIVNNETFYIRAFLDHYRRLGVRQFLFLDDGSTDGTFEFLESQADCILARSTLRYGDRVNGRRAVHIWKSEIPRRFMLGQWALCVDADELLFIPPQFRTIEEFIREVDQRGATSVAAIMVDFYPENVGEMARCWHPQNKDELLFAYPWFDAGPYFAWRDAVPCPKFIHGGVRERLLKKFDVSRRTTSKSGWKLVRHAAKDILFGKQYIKPISVTKVPIAKWIHGREYVNSHRLNEEVKWDIFLPIAHFKFTSSLYEKIFLATASFSYSDSSRAYFEYADLLERMKSIDSSFLCERSVRLEQVEDFKRFDLMSYS